MVARGLIGVSNKPEYDTSRRGDQLEHFLVGSNILKCLFVLLISLGRSRLRSGGMILALSFLLFGLPINYRQISNKYLLVMMLNPVFFVLVPVPMR